MGLEKQSLEVTLTTFTTFSSCDPRLGAITLTYRIDLPGGSK